MLLMMSCDDTCDGYFRKQFVFIQPRHVSLLTCQIMLSLASTASPYTSFSGATFPSCLILLAVLILSQLLLSLHPLFFCSGQHRFLLRLRCERMMAAFATQLI